MLQILVKAVLPIGITVLILWRKRLNKRCGGPGVRSSGSRYRYCTPRV
jgi:hypothetical protein